jgi:hypothetical protein
MRRPRHWRPQLALATVVAAVPLTVAACGSGQGSSAAAQTKAPTALCQQLDAVLSDGPDPTADPVGYALSQILPLGKIHTSDRSGASTLKGLIAADKAFVASNGSDKAAKTTIARAYASFNRVCPGVAP